MLKGLKTFTQATYINQKANGSMKRPLIFVQNPNALKNWLSASGPDAKVLYDLEELNKRFNPEEVILLVQLSESTTHTKLNELTQQGFEILAFSDEPSNTEGLQLFQNGIKGYLNTYATVERINQAITTIEAGSIWLGQSIMQSMIGQLSQATTKEVTQNNEWQNLLTEREKQVVDLVLKMQSNREIGEQLDITERTVKSHMHNIFEKLNVSDRLALALKIHNW